MIDFLNKYGLSKEDILEIKGHFDEKFIYNLVVMKNNVAECVLLSPEEYIAIIDELEDMYLMAEARSRMENFNVDKLISREEFDRRFGITEEDIEDFEGVDFE